LKLPKGKKAKGKYAYMRDWIYVLTGTRFRTFGRHCMVPSVALLRVAHNTWHCEVLYIA